MTTITRADLEDYLRSKAGRGFRVHAGNGYLACPSCSSDRALIVCMQDGKLGIWNCKACGQAGHLDALRELWGDPPLRKAPQGRPPGVSKVAELAAGISRRTFGKGAATGGSPTERREPSTGKRRGAFDCWHPQLDVDCQLLLHQEDGAPVLEYLTQGRGLSLEAIRHWRLGAFLVPSRPGRPPWRFVAIPVYGYHGELALVRFRPVPGPCPLCGGQGCPDPPKGARRKCDGGQVAKAYYRTPDRPSTLYGAHRLPTDHSSTVIVTEGELDAVALWDYGHRDVGLVSGTTGASGWADAWLDLLEPYQQFVLAYDTDQAGDEGAAKLADQLGRYRCSRARMPRKDAGECLQEGVPAEQVRRAIEGASPLLDVKIRRLGYYAQQIEDLIQAPDTLRGLRTSSGRLDKCIGGWRPGLVVVTGDTSSGKTSFTTWAMLQQARAGAPVLLTAFEQRIDLVAKLLRIELGGDFTRNTPAERATALQALDQLPLYVVDHYGHLEPAKLIETIRYAVRRHGARLVVVDHLGFVLDPKADDERRMIEAIVRALFSVAKADGITVVLVCHPNRGPVMQNRRVTIRDLKGASAIEQDADLGLVVERVPPRKGDQQGKCSARVHVDKCRSEFGVIGSSCVLWYDPEACRYSDEWVDLPASGRAGLQVNPAGTPTGERLPYRDD